jgi:hypothetical protein
MENKEPKIRYIREPFHCERCNKLCQFAFSEGTFNLKTEPGQDFLESLDKYLLSLNINLSEHKTCLECYEEKRIAAESESEQLDKLEEELKLEAQKIRKNDDPTPSIRILLPIVEKELNSISKGNSETIDQEYQKNQQTFSELEESVKEKEKELDALFKELETVSKEENNFWEDYNNCEKNIYNTQKQKAFIENQTLILTKQIKSLSISNIFSDLFNINFSDKKGTINYCKMAYTTSNTSYDEMNAGWGYIVFLTKILANKFNFESTKYNLVYYGNYSYLQKKDIKDQDNDENNKFELSISDNSRTLERFNTAMKKFMEYFGEFYAFLGRKPDLKLDEFELEINGECIEGKSICLDTNKAEEWGQCIKYLLTILKFLLTQVLKIEDDAYKSILENAKILSASLSTSGSSGNK